MPRMWTDQTIAKKLGEDLYFPCNREFGAKPYDPLRRIRYIIRLLTASGDIEPAGTYGRTRVWSNASYVKIKRIYRKIERKHSDG
jgi:hypothetical protein